MQQDDTKAWMKGAAERTIKVALMTAEKLTQKNEPLDARDMEKLHWCWECIESVKSACLLSAQIAAHEAEHAPMGMEDIAKMLKALDEKVSSVVDIPEPVAAK